MLSCWKYKASIKARFLLAVILYSMSAQVDAKLNHSSLFVLSKNPTVNITHLENIGNTSSKKMGQDEYKKDCLTSYQEVLVFSTDVKATEKLVFDKQCRSVTRERNTTEAATIISGKQEEAPRFQHQMLDGRSEATDLVRLDKTMANKSHTSAFESGSPEASQRVSASATSATSAYGSGEWLKSTATTMAPQGAVEMRAQLAGAGEQQKRPLSDKPPRSSNLSLFRNGKSRSQDQQMKAVAGDQTAIRELLRPPLSPTLRKTREASAASSDGDVETIRALIGHRLVIPCAVQVPPGGEPVNGASRRVNSAASSRTSSGAGGGQVSGGHRVSGLAITLIVWHKDEQLNWPIFSADARGSSSLREAKQQTNHDSPLKGRAHLEEWRGPGSGNVPGAALVIDEAGQQDGGVYTCTLEFNKAPTQTRRMRIILIDPPRNMTIRHSLIATGSRQTLERDSSEALGDGDLAATSMIEPFDEDSRVLFTCRADPGYPPGQIAWWQLKSVWALPVTATSGKQRPSKLISSLEALENKDPSDQGLLTISLPDTDLASHSLPANHNNGHRDYFVALHQPSNSKESASSKHSRAEMLLAMAGNQLPIDPTASGPKTLKQWRRVKQQTLATLPGGKIQSTFELQLSRSTLGTEYLCSAQNTDFGPPLNSSLKINLSLKPTEVRITNKAKPHLFKVGQKMTIECQVYGSQPEPQIRWFKGLQELDQQGSGRPDLAGSDGHFHVISELNRDSSMNNATKSSYLTLIPQQSDNQQTLTCSAHNPRMTAEPLTDSIVMNVQFPAQLTLQYGTSIRQESIKLDTDVYMDCNVQANPPIDELGWLHNDKPLIANASAGYVMSNQSLIIQRIRIEHRGHYQCVAMQNSMGKYYSNKLELKPKFEPVCDYSLTRAKYEIPVNQPTRIECNVLAEPTEDLHFTWKFNQTFGSLVPSAHALDDTSPPELGSHHHHLEEIKQYETNFTRSYIMFTPESKRRYGQLLCSASNSMGKQMRPCVIQVVESVLPDPIFSCFSDNQTKSSLSVHCQSAPDLQQTSVGRINYLLELYRANDSSSQSSKDDSDEEDPTNDVATAAGSAIQHLRQREPSAQESMMDDNGNPYESHQQTALVEAKPMRKLVSETPTFHLSNLKPGSGYNLVIYVQNAKGRSTPYFFPANTLPDLAASALYEQSQRDSAAGNKIQLSSNQQRSIWDKLTWPPSFADYLSGGDSGSRALLSVALLVLLCTVSAVTLAFFVSRMCRGARGNNGSAPKSRDNKNNNNKAYESRRNSLVGYEDEVNKSQSSELKVTNSTPSRLKALAGSGSDTSRETNTDSTLISLVRPTAAMPAADLTPVSCQQQGGCLSGNVDGIYVGSQRRSMTAYGSVRHNQTGANLTESPSIGQTLNAASSHLQFTTTTNDQQQPRRRLNSRQHQNQQAGVYSALKRSLMVTGCNAAGLRSGPSPELAPANTPQVSIQSGGSDCTSATTNTATHNDLLQANANSCSIAEQFSQQHSNANLGHEDQLQQPVYVIGQHHPLAGALPSPGSGHYTGQLRLLTAVETGARFWADDQQRQQVNSPHSSSDQQTNSSCRIIGDVGGVVDIQNGCQAEHRAILDSVAASELPIPISLLPNSMSIPVSLGDCVSTMQQQDSLRTNHHNQKYQHNHHHHHHHSLRNQLSHDFLAHEDLNFEQQHQQQQHQHNNGSSYLTLAPSHRVQQVRASSSCCQPVAYLDGNLIGSCETTANGRHRHSIVASDGFSNQDPQQLFGQPFASEHMHYGCEADEDHQVPPPFAELPVRCHENPTKAQTVRFEYQESQDNLVMNNNPNERRDT